MKPGYKTSEFWITLGVLVIGFLVQLGFLKPADVGAVTDGWSACVNSIFTLVTQLTAALAYLYSRHQLKSGPVGQVDRVKDTITALNTGPRPSPLPLILAAAVGLFLAGPVMAQAPSSNPPPPYLLSWRAWVHQNLNQKPQTDPAVTSLLQQQTLLHQQQVALQTQILALLQSAHVPAPTPAPAPVPAPTPSPQNSPLIVLLTPPGSGGALQSFPLQGQPLQSFPIQGQPLQTFPIQGQPLQSYPIQGQPLQPFPIQGQPLQAFPVAPAPGPAPAPPPMQPPVPKTPAPLAPILAPSPQAFPIAPNPQPVQPAPPAMTFQRFTTAIGVPRP